MGRKADALRITNAQTGEYLAVTREIVGLDEDGSSVGIEVRTYDHDGHNESVHYADSVEHAHTLMVQAAAEAAAILLNLKTRTNLRR